MYPEPDIVGRRERKIGVVKLVVVVRLGDARCRDIVSASLPCPNRRHVDEYTTTCAQ